MNDLNQNKAGLLGALVAGVCAIVWSILVGLGLAHDLLNWIFSLQFIINPFQVTSFDWGTAALLVILAVIWGYILAWLLAAGLNLSRRA